MYVSVSLFAYLYALLYFFSLFFFMLNWNFILFYNDQVSLKK